MTLLCVSSAGALVPAAAVEEFVLVVFVPAELLVTPTGAFAELDEFVAVGLPHPAKSVNVAAMAVSCIIFRFQDVKFCASFSLAYVCLRAPN